MEAKSIKIKFRGHAVTDPADLCKQPLPQFELLIDDQPLDGLLLQHVRLEFDAAMQLPLLRIVAIPLTLAIEVDEGVVAVVPGQQLPSAEEIQQLLHAQHHALQPTPASDPDPLGTNQL
jgi:hypothetical protein